MATKVQESCECKNETTSNCAKCNSTLSEHELENDKYNCTCNVCCEDDDSQCKICFVCVDYTQDYEPCSKTVIDDIMEAIHNTLDDKYLNKEPYNKIGVSGTLNLLIKAFKCFKFELKVTATTNDFLAHYEELWDVFEGDNIHTTCPVCKKDVDLDGYFVSNLCALSSHLIDHIEDKTLIDAIINKNK